MLKKFMSLFLTTLLLAVCFFSAVPVSATEVYYSEAINTLASENLSGDDYSVGSNEKHVSNAYTSEKTTTGSGWYGLWSSSGTEYKALTMDEDLDVQYKKLARKGATTNSTIKFFMVNDKDDPLMAYRLFAEPLNFDIAGNVYEFSFDFLDGNGTKTRRVSTFRFDVGGLFTVGYDRNEEKTHITPVIIVGENKISSNESIEVGGGASSPTYGELLTFTVRVEIGGGANGLDDKITLQVQDNPELQFTSNWTSGIDTTVYELTHEADLNGTVGYIGFGNAEPTAAYDKRIMFRNINVREIQSCEANKDCVATVNTSIRNADVAFGKTISATIDVESISDNNANILSVVAIKKGNKLVGIDTAEATLSSGAKTGTMIVSYTFGEENGWDAGSFDAEEIGVSFYVWNKDTLTPYINKLGFSAEKYH